MRLRTAFLIALLFGFAVQAQDANFRVEKLSADEIKKFNAAETALKRAKQEHDKIVSELKSHYGDSSDIIWNSFSSCGDKKTSVELRGEYALITSWIDNRGCAILSGPTVFNGCPHGVGCATSIPIPQKLPPAFWISDPLSGTDEYGGNWALITGDPQWIGHWECPAGYKAIEHDDSHSDHLSTAICLPK